MTEKTKATLATIGYACGLVVVLSILAGLPVFLVAYAIELTDWGQVAHGAGELARDFKDGLEGTPQ